MNLLQSNILMQPLHDVCPIAKCSVDNAYFGKLWYHYRMSITCKTNFEMPSKTKCVQSIKMDKGWMTEAWSLFTRKWHQVNPAVTYQFWCYFNPADQRRRLPIIEGEATD